MAARGVHFALTPQEESRLLAAAGNDAALLGVVQEEIEERWDVAWLCETDKAWDAIHRCLTDGTLDRTPPTPERMCVLGGRQLHRGRDQIVCYLAPPEVALVSEAVAPVTEADFRARYDTIGAHGYAGPVSEDDFGYTWSYFELLRGLFAKAAVAGRAMVFSVDQ